MKTKRLMYILLLMASAYYIKAQDSSKIAVTHPITLLIGVGSQGGVVELKYGFRPKLNIRAGTSFISVNNLSNVITFSGGKNDNVASGNLSNAHLFLDYSPFKRLGFRLVGGAGYFYKGDAVFDVKAKGSFFFGDIPLTAETVGSTKLSASWRGVAPYLGIGLFKCMPKHFFNVNLDIGSYYLPKPTATITGTGLLEANTSNQEQLQENLADYRWLPVFQLNFNFKF